MTKTTVYLPEELKTSLSRLAEATGRSEAELIRQAIDALVRTSERPRPRGGLFAGDGEPLAERDEEALAGFGER